MNEEETKPKSEEEEPQNIKKQRLEALYKEYATRTKEIEFHSGRYHRQVGYVQTYLAAISSLASLIYFGKDGANKLFSDGAHQLEMFGVLAFLTLFLFFLFATMMDSLFMLMVNGKYVATIEKRVNDEIGEEALMGWENKIIPYFLGDKWWAVNGWLKPQPLIYIFVGLLFCLAIMSLCYFCWLFAASYMGWYAVSTILLSSFLLTQWVKLITVGAWFIEAKSFELCKLKTSMHYDTDLVAFAIPPLTVILGFGVMAFWAFQTSTHLAIQNSEFFGLFTIPSIFIGDFFLLPVINLQIYLMLKTMFGTNKIDIFMFIKSALFCFAASFVIMCGIHYLWVNDDYLGFMDFSKGELSSAGKWHLVFSTFEFGLILLLLKLGAFNSDMRQKFLEIWFLVVGFSFISVVDSFVRQYWVFDKSFFGSLCTMLCSSEIFSMGSFFLALLIYYVVKKIDDISKVLPSLSRL